MNRITKINRIAIFAAIVSLSGLTVVYSQISSIAANAQRRILQENENHSKYRDAVQLLYRNASTLEAKNLDAYMDTISKDCVTHDLTASITKNILEMDLDLKVDIVSFNILPGGTDEMVEIDCVTSSKKVGGEARFANNKLRAIHTLVKTDNKWQILGTKILKVDMIYDD